MKHVNVSIGKRIRTAQRMLGHSDRQVAEMLGMSVSGYRKMVNGKRAITEENLIKLANSWNLDMNYLFHGKSHNIFLSEHNSTASCLPEEDYVCIITPKDSLAIIPTPEWMLGDR